VQRISKPARTTVGDLENEGEMSSNIFNSTNSLLVNAAEEEAGRRTHLKSKVSLGLAGCAAECYKLARVVGTSTLCTRVHKYTRHSPSFVFSPRPTGITTMSQNPPAISSSANYQLIFDNALEAYKKKTGKDLTSDPLLTRLKSCDSPHAVLALLRDQVPGFDQSGSNSTSDRLTKWLDPTVNVLYTFSSMVGGALSLVSLCHFKVICQKTDALLSNF
jgi:hypothetical protein